MAVLSTEEREEVRRLLAKRYSLIRTQVPITKSEFVDLIDLIDDEVNSLETAVFQALPAGPGKTWLNQNRPISRNIVEEIVRKRTEVLP